MLTSKTAAFFVLIFISLNANAKDSRKAFVDNYVSVEVPWEMERTDSAGTLTMRHSFGSSLLMITRSEVSDPLPADREELEERYSTIVSTYIQSLHGRLTDSSTFVSNGVIGKKVHVAYRQNDSDFVAEAIFILGNHRQYAVQNLHVVSATPVPAAERAMNSVAPTNIFTPDRQFEKKAKFVGLRSRFCVGPGIRLCSCNLYCGVFLVSMDSA